MRAGIKNRSHYSNYVNYGQVINSKAKNVQIMPHITATKIFNHRGLRKIMLATMPPIPRATIASIPMVDTYISAHPLTNLIKNYITFKDI